MSNTTQLKQFIRTAYAWPGGYPMYAVCSDGGCLCHTCTKGNAKQVIAATRSDDRGGWAVACVDVNWEDTALYCDHCSAQIESAYGGDE